MKRRDLSLASSKRNWNLCFLRMWLLSNGVENKFGLKLLVKCCLKKIDFAVLVQLLLAFEFFTFVDLNANFYNN